MPKKRRYSFGKSIGAFFHVLEKIVRGGAPQPEPEKIYVPFTLEIKVAPLRIYSHGRLLHAKGDKEGARLAHLLEINQVMEILEILDEID